MTYIKFMLFVAINDVKTSFLHGEFKEEIYMTQPNNYIEKVKETLI